MTEVTPQAGDVWLGEDGEMRFIIEPAGGWLQWRNVEDGTDYVSHHEQWFATATRVHPSVPVFPPVPAPQGETITRHCILCERRDGGVVVEDLKGESLPKWTERHAVRVLAQFDVVAPKSLLSVPVLPAVTVTP